MGKIRQLGRKIRTMLKANVRGKKTGFSRLSGQAKQPPLTLSQIAAHATPLPTPTPKPLRAPSAEEKQTIEQTHAFVGHINNAYVRRSIRSTRRALNGFKRGFIVYQKNMAAFFNSRNPVARQQYWIRANNALERLQTMLHQQMEWYRRLQTSILDWEKLKKNKVRIDSGVEKHVEAKLRILLHGDPKSTKPLRLQELLESIRRVLTKFTEQQKVLEKELKKNQAHLTKQQPN